MTRRLVALAVLVGGAIAGASATFPVSDGDLYWHLATAQQTLLHGLVQTDLFSWTAAGAAVPTDQWLGDVLLYAGYSAASWTGVLAVRTIAIAVLIAAVALAAFVRRSASPVVALVVSLPAIVLSRYLWTERPELFGAACFAVLVLALQLPGRRPLVAVAPLLILWANLHGSFALGSVLVLLGVGADLVTERSLRREHAIAVAGALVALVATPAVLLTLSTPGTHLLSPPREIQEWAPPDPTTAPGALWAITLLLTLATASVSGRARARDVALIVPLAALSLVAIRHAPLFAIAATPYLAEQLPSAIRVIRAGARAPTPGGRGPRARETPRASAAAALVPTLAGVALLLAGVVVSPREPDESAFPVGALASLPSGPGLLAEYDWGGWLIWRAPRTPVFVDGRLTPYRGPVLGDYVTVVEARPGWRDVLDRRAVKWLLVRPGDPVAVRAQDLGWPVLSQSPVYVLISVVHH